MRQIYIFIIAALTFVLLCIAIVHDEQVTKSDRDSIQAQMSHGVSDGYSTIVIDSCEYIEAIHGLAHKGKCKFCAERHRNEINDLVKQLNKH